MFFHVKLNIRNGKQKPSFLRYGTPYFKYYSLPETRSGPFHIPDTIL